ncbi:MAG: ATP-binding cassette domain-containing protein [Dehalococcoidales bacterium]|nr:MAG: ATP-binding cassette domain-containing protein [Dehalococcoidales bacterium]
METKDEPLVVVDNLHTYFPVRAGVLQKKVADLKAVAGVSFHIKRGETLGLIGESGCGKTTLGRSILQLLKPTSGSVYFDGADLSKLNAGELRKMRQHMQMMFENPYSSLDPGMKVGKIIAEPLQIHKLASKEELDDRAREMLVMVGLEADMTERYPSEFSGGQRQRIELARALTLRPSFIVCDNPLAQLDVSIQAQLIELLTWLRNWRQLTYLFIAHDLALVRRISHRVAVMYLGIIVETAETDELFGNALHPYTKALLSAVPVPDPAERDRRILLLPGDPPSPINPPSGCRFHPRCNVAIERCSQAIPDLREIGSEGHEVACHLA